jgi:hypothetical protein
MRVCVECEREVIAEGFVFTCDCGVAFCVEVVKQFSSHTVVKPEIGLPLPGTKPFTNLTGRKVLVA